MAKPSQITQNIYPKNKRLNMFWTRTVSKGGLKGLGNFIMLYDFRNLMFSNGSKNVRGVILLAPKRYFCRKITKIVHIQSHKLHGCSVFNRFKPLWFCYCISLAFCKFSPTTYRKTKLGLPLFPFV